MVAVVVEGVDAVVDAVGGTEQERQCEGVKHVVFTLGFEYELPVIFFKGAMKEKKRGRNMVFMG